MAHPSTVRRQANRILVNARDLIENGWVQNAFSRDKNKQRVQPSSPEATCYCADGALRAAASKITGYEMGLAYIIAEGRLQAVMGGKNGDTIHTANDRRTTKKEHVLMAFDLAILGAGHNL